MAAARRQQDLIRVNKNLPHTPQAEQPQQPQQQAQLPQQQPPQQQRDLGVATMKGEAVQSATLQQAQVTLPGPPLLPEQPTGSLSPSAASRSAGVKRCRATTQPSHMDADGGAYRYGELVFEERGGRVPYLIVPARANSASEILRYMINCLQLPRPSLALSVRGNASTSYMQWFREVYDDPEASKAWGWRKEGDKKGAAKVPANQAMRQFGSQLVETFGYICRAAVESRAWLWTSAVRGPRQQLMGDAITKRALRDYVWVGYSPLRVGEDDGQADHPLASQSGEQPGLDQPADASHRSALEPPELRDLLMRCSVPLHSPDGPLPPVVEQVVVPNGSGLFPVGSSLWMDEPLQVVESLVSQAAARRGTSMLCPFVTHLVFVDDTHTRKIREVYDLLEMLGVVQGLICVNGRPEEVYSAGTAFIEQMRPVISFLNGGGASHGLAQAIRHFKAQTIVEADKRARATMAAHGKRQPHKPVPGGSAISKVAPLLLPAEALARTIKIPRHADSDCLVALDLSDETAGEALQRRIANCLGRTVSEEDKELDFLDAEAARITNAWELYMFLSLNAKFQLVISRAIHYSLLACNFVASAVGIVSAFLRFTPPKLYLKLDADVRTTIDTVLSFTVVVLPLLSSVLIAVLNRFSPDVNHARYKNLALQVKSEIYRYRTRTGDYASNKRAQNLDWQQDLRDLRAMDASTSTATEQNPPNEASAGRHSSEASALPPSSSSRPHPSSSFSTGKDLVAKHTRRKNFGESLVELTSAARALEPGLLDTDLIKFAVASHLSSLAKMTTTTATSETEITCDDGLKALDGDQYVRFRLKVLIGKYRTNIPRLNTLKNIEQILIYCISAATAMLGTMGLSLWVSLAVAGSSAIQAAMDFQQVRTMVVAESQALMMLTDTLLWWSSLSFVERRLFATKNQLVEMTERAHLSSVAMLDASRKEFKQKQQMESNDHGGNGSADATSGSHDDDGVQGSEGVSRPKGEARKSVMVKSASTAKREWVQPNKVDHVV